jgi:hypothetical protein
VLPVTPLEPGAQGALAHDLHDALRALLDHAVIRAGDEGARRELMAILQHDLPNGIYGDGTKTVVSTFQDEQGIGATGVVDQRTADAINGFLAGWGLLDQPAPGDAVGGVVTGRVTSSSRPAPGVTVRAVHVSATGEIRLGEDATDADGRYTIIYGPLGGVEAITLRVQAFDATGAVVVQSDPAPAPALASVDLTLPAIEAFTPSPVLRGRVVLEQGLPANGLKLRAYRHDFNADPTMLAESVTDDQGLYAFTWGGGQPPPNVEVRAVDGEREVGLTSIVGLVGDGASPVNIVAPAELRPLPSEFQRLSDAIAPQVGDLSNLKNVREDDERQDLSVLSEATNWDARLVALAAIASNVADPDVGLSAKALYGLFRAGLPHDGVQLALTHPDTVGRALDAARASGIVDLTDDEVAQAKTAFEGYALKVRRSLPTPGSNATYDALIASTPLSADQRDAFARAVLFHEGDADSLWQSVDAVGLGEEVPALKLHGKFAFLTVNNPDLTAHLQQSVGVADPADLVAKDFHLPATWESEVRNLAGGDDAKLASLVPAAYEGETTADRLAAYAEDLARKIRISYPTQVVGRIVATDDADQLQLGDARQPSATFLQQATAKGFELGKTPFHSFADAHPEALDGLADGDREAARTGVERLHRVFQLSPSNESMTALLKAGLHSAYDVASIPYDAFIDRYRKELPSGEAELVHRRSQQISAVTTNLFSIAKGLESTPPVSVLTPAVADREATRQELGRHFPTLESLFGSLDFCECEDCRSVFSPAAYLVDLLQSLDPEDAKPGETKPYDVLVARRPDIPNIELTCANTQVALPYIDVVNEILEYFVANQKLEADAAYDTGNASTEELLAEPQHVIVEAYAKVEAAVYPLGLPFDLWLETARGFCEHFELALWEVLEALRRSDDLFDPTQIYDRAAVFAEQLGIGPSEYRLFTDPQLLDRWFELYGFPDAAAATTVATDPETGQRVDLNSAKALARRLGVTYQELGQCLQSGFVNPLLPPLVILHKLEVSVADVIAYAKDKALEGQDESTLSADDKRRLDEARAFEARLDALEAEFASTGFHVRDWLDDALDENAFDRILVLADPDAGCDFDATTVQYASGAPAVPIAFLRLNLFVRLWRRLGWAFDETDAALRAFVPKNVPFDDAHVAQAPMRTALLYLAHLGRLAQITSLGNDARTRLLTLWEPLPTTGPSSLYARLFLNRGVLASDGVFDDPLGNYLTPESVAAASATRWHDVQVEGVAAADEIDPAAFAGHPNVKVAYDPLTQIQRLSHLGPLPDDEKAALAALSPAAPLPGLLDAVQQKAQEFLLVKGHLLAIQAATGLADDDVARILAEGPESFDEASLTLDTVSRLYAHQVLARALGISVRDLMSLKALSGLDPFSGLPADPPETIEDDQPHAHVLHLVELAQMLADVGLQLEQLDYLLRHRYVADGPYAPDETALLTLAKTLADGIQTIRTANAVPEDPASITDEWLGQKLGLILERDVADRFLAMLNGSALFTATRDAAAPFPEDGFVGVSSVTVSFTDEPQKRQTLIYRGVLLDEAKAALEQNFPRPAEGAPFVASPLLAGLLDDVQAQARTFFQEKLQRADDGVLSSGFLKPEDFDILFAPPPDDPAEAQAQLTARRAQVAAAFLPVLEERLVREFVIATMIGATGANPLAVEPLLTDLDLVAGPQTLATALTSVADRGVTGTFYASTDRTGEPLAPAVMLDDADTALRDVAGPLAGAASTTFEGSLEVPVSGPYIFSIALEKTGARAELSFDGQPAPLPVATAAADGVTQDLGGAIQLQAGAAYRFTLHVDSLGGGNASILVRADGLTEGPLGRLTLHPLARFERAQLLLTKALSLIEALGLDDQEVRHLFARDGGFGGLDLGSLPTAETDVGAQDRFAQVVRLARYAALKRDLAGATNVLGGLFDAQAADRADLIAQVSRRQPQTVEATARALFRDTQIADDEALERLWKVLRIVEQLGVSVSDVVSWTRIVSSSADAVERAAIARALKDAVRARFDPDTWDKVAQRIFDRLRGRQRDALVAYVMWTQGFARPEELYERFLIDSSMEPVVQTSRIRLAIASVQLFVQRCLLNLEPEVAPSAINAKQWEWMKRYRVWEANRRIFLYPENWLEGEFRDDKTGPYRQLESTLAQTDISDEAAEDAFLAYLKSLEELARLEIMAMYLDNRDDPAINTLHVVGRTFSEPHKFFHRQFVNEMWTPWETITADVKGDHVAPVVWRNRLYLFWVTFHEQTDPSQGLHPKSKFGAISHTAITQGSSYSSLVTSSNASLVKGEDTSTKNLTEVSAADLASDVRAASTGRIVEAHLHWSEYVGGDWSTSESGSVDFPLRALIAGPLDRSSVFLHVSKVPAPDGEEGGIEIHLGGSVNQAFFLASRNSVPVRADRQGQPAMPLSQSGSSAGRYMGEGALTVTLRRHIETEDGKTPASVPETLPILQAGGSYLVIPTDNAVAANDNLEIGSLAAPVFYQDALDTFFIEPSVTETTVEEWQEWVIHTSVPDEETRIPDSDALRAFVAQAGDLVPVDPSDPIWGDPDPRSTYRVKTHEDWLANPSSVLQFGSELIGPNGRSGLRLASTNGAAPGVQALIPVRASSAGDGRLLELPHGASPPQNNGLIVEEGLNLVGDRGFETGLVARAGSSPSALRLGLNHIQP